MILYFFFCYLRHQLAIRDNGLEMIQMMMDNTFKYSVAMILGLRGGLMLMKKNCSIESISNTIIKEIHNFKFIYKSEWFNASTDLQHDLGMSWLEITKLLLEIEDKTGIKIAALPVHYVPSFSIGYLVTLFTYAETFDPDHHEAELFRYACENVPIYKDAALQDSKDTQYHSNIFKEYCYHRIGDEFDSIAERYYSQYQHGEILCNKVVELSGEYRFSMCSEVEKLISELPLWRKRTEWYGIMPDYKFVQFITENIVGNRLAPPKTSSFLENKGLCLVLPENVMTHNDEGDWLDELTSFAPKWFKGTSCSIYALCIIIRRLGKSFDNVTYIEIEAENPVSTDIIKYVNDTFVNAKLAVVITNNHVGPLFYTCPSGHNHNISSKVSILSTDDYKHSDFPYSALLVTSYYRTVAPVISIDSFLWGNITKDSECNYQDAGDIVDIMPACGFDGFSDKNNSFVSVATIRMCVSFVNSEYNNPISAIQMVQVKQGTVRLYLLIKVEFVKWERKLAESITSTLSKWGTTDMEWEVVFQDELFPYEYTSAKIYYQNRRE